MICFSASSSLWIGGEEGERRLLCTYAYFLRKMREGKREAITNANITKKQSNVISQTIKHTNCSHSNHPTPSSKSFPCPDLQHVSPKYQLNSYKLYLPVSNQIEILKSPLVVPISFTTCLPCLIRHLIPQYAFIKINHTLSCVQLSHRTKHLSTSM